jgi:hypothetical protein
MDKVIRISPFPLPNTDIHPSYELGECFSFMDICYSRFKHTIWREMEIGYLTAARSHHLLVKKGMQELSVEMTTDSQTGKPKQDEFGVVGSLDHFLNSSEGIFEKFTKNDPRGCIW